MPLWKPPLYDGMDWTQLIDACLKRSNELNEHSVEFLRELRGGGIFLDPNDILDRRDYRRLRDIWDYLTKPRPEPEGHSDPYAD